jgi:hypothetical protein
MKFGLDRLLTDEASLRAPLRGRRVALLAHPASVTADLTHALDALAALPEIRLTAAFGPQHGLRGDKQDNMVESPDYQDPLLGIPVFSLYGQVRRPTPAMMDSFDVLLVDLQDLGCRIYTFITTLLYVLEEAARHGKTVIVLDRPNPAGRPVEGTTLQAGWESFVGAGPLPMRHGLTLGEMGRWFVKHFKLDVDYQVIAMEGWNPDSRPRLRLAPGRAGMDQPQPQRRQPVHGPLLCRHGHAGRHHPLGGTRHHPAPGTVRRAGPGTTPTRWRKCAISPPTGCEAASCGNAGSSPPSTSTCWPALRRHPDSRRKPAATTTPRSCPGDSWPWPSRLCADCAPDYPLWRDFPYEYEHDRLAIDLINGGPILREWVDDAEALPGDLGALARRDEAAWREETAALLLYR